MVLPTKCLGTGSGGSTRFRAEVETTCVEMLPAGMDRWGWSSPKGLSGGGEARPGGPAATGTGGKAR